MGTHHGDIPTLMRHWDDMLKTAPNPTQLNDLRHNLKRGKEFGYEHLVRKHSAAVEIMSE